MRKREEAKRELSESMTPNDVVEQAGVPSAIDAEKSLLGAILIDNMCMFQTENDLRAQDFYAEQHRLIFNAMRELISSGKQCDLVTLHEKLDRDKLTDRVGGVTYISALTDGLPRKTSIKSWTEIVKRKSVLRQIIAQSTLAASRAVDGDNIVEIITDLDQSLLALSASQRDQKTDSIKEACSSALNQLVKQRASKRELLGLTYGVKHIDEATTGLRAGEVTVIAGSPGAGKTAFLCKMIAANCRRGDPVGVFSLEMRRESIVYRLLGAEAEMAASFFRDPRDILDEEWEKAQNSLGDIAQWPLFLDDTARLSISEVIARARMMQSRGAKAIFIDFLQLIRVPDLNTDFERINEASAQLREFSASSGLPVVELSQLARSKDGVVRRPKLSDLKGSGNIEQDASNVGFLWRPLAKKGWYTGEDEFIIAKQRNGPVGSIPMHYDAQNLNWIWREIVEKEEKKAKDGKADAVEAPQDNQPTQQSLI